MCLSFHLELIFQSIYNENLKQLQKGQQLDSLPKIPLPHLPHIPMVSFGQYLVCDVYHDPKCNKKNKKRNLFLFLSVSVFRSIC